MNNLKFFAIIAFALFAAIAINAQHNYAFEPDETDLVAVDSVEDVVLEQVAPIELETIDSEQYNKWSKSSNFVKGIEAMFYASSISDDSISINEDKIAVYKKAITFFQKELKQHPKNGYAKCNIAMCKHHIASSTLNKYLLNLFDNEMMDAVSEEKLEALEEGYQEKLKEKEKDVREAIKTLDEGLSMIPAADKEIKCQVLIKKYEMLILKLL